MRTKSAATAVLLAAAPIGVVLVLVSIPGQIAVDMLFAGVPLLFAVSGLGHVYLREYKRGTILIASSMILASLTAHDRFKRWG